MALLALLGILFSIVGSAVFMNQSVPTVGTPIVSSEVTTISSEVSK